MLVAGGGPTTPDPRVLRAMTLPVIGQFDPAFTQVMDEVMHLARQVFLTRNAACFAVSAPRRAGIDALLNTVPDNASVRVVDATEVLGAREFRVDDVNVDACVAAADWALGGPPGLCLVTYSKKVEELMRARTSPPPSNYLDLLQLQAYWSPERLNHHTAPTSLIYGLREALRFVVDEGLEERWARHQRVFDVLAAGFQRLHLHVRAEPPTFVLDVGPSAPDVRRRLAQEFDVHVGTPTRQSLRIGLVGPNATEPAAMRLLTAIGHVLA
jgi:aspartate aminotransferase-like enzyme